MSPFNALKHLVYFEVLADTDENTEKWNTTTAGLVVLRLLDNWYDQGSQYLKTNRRGVKNIRAAINAIDEKNFVHKVLLGILQSIESAKHPDLSDTLQRLMAYARVLQYEDQFKLSADVYQTIVDYAEQTEVSDVQVQALIQLGHTQRTMGYYADAAQSYSQAGQIAAGTGDTESRLKAQMGDARLALDLGKHAEAGALLDDCIAQTAAIPSLAAIRCAALHDRSAVAFRCAQFAESLKFAWESFRIVQTPTHSSRLLADMAASLAELNLLNAARDALYIVAKTADEPYLRWVAEINLIEINSRIGDEAAVELLRQSLSSADLPMAIEANYHLHLGRAYHLLGKREAARVALERAVECATTNNFTALKASADANLLALDQEGAVVEDDVVVHEKEIEDIAAAVTEMSKSAVRA